MNLQRMLKGINNKLVSVNKGPIQVEKDTAYVAHQSISPSPRSKSSYLSTH